MDVRWRRKRWNFNWLVFRKHQLRANFLLTRHITLSLDTVVMLFGILGRCTSRCDLILHVENTKEEPPLLGFSPGWAVLLSSYFCCVYLFRSQWFTNTVRRNTCISITDSEVLRSLGVFVLVSVECAGKLILVISFLADLLNILGPILSWQIYCENEMTIPTVRIT